MKIGFIRGLTIKSEMVKNCDKIIFADETKGIGQAMAEFIENHSEEELFFQSLVELRLQISQMLPILEKATERSVRVSFIDKGHLSQLTDQEYMQILLGVSRQEKEIRSICTKESIARVRREGTVIGRPSISDETIKEIKLLCHKHGKSIREVSAICGVSIGTVHKYSKKISE